VIPRTGGHHLGGVQAVHQPGGVDLAGEPDRERRVRGQIGMADLDRHRPAGRGVAEEHLAHPARAEPRVQPELTHLPRVTHPERLHG
jgi:hypothetical protein